MSEELAVLADEALEHRNWLGSAETRREIIWLALSCTMAGERTAKEKGLSVEHWTRDLDCRRAAVMRLCEVALTGFLSADPEEQLYCVAALKGRVALPLYNPRLNRKREGRE